MRQQKINYQKELEKTLEAIRREERVPTLLLIDFLLSHSFSFFA